MKLNKLLIQEDKYWRQRAKTHWMRDGDVNTHFFHASTSTRKHKNEIKSFHDTDGVVINWQTDLGELAQSYFNDLFGEHHTEFATVIDAVPQQVDSVDNS